MSPAGRWAQHDQEQGPRKTLLWRGSPCLAQASLGPALSALPLHKQNHPTDQVLAGLCPIPGAGRHAETKLQAQRLARRPSAPQHSSALNFPTKRPVGGRKEGGLQGRQAERVDDSTAIPSDWPSWGEEEGTRFWLPQEPIWGVQRGLPGLTQAAHLLPCNRGRGRGSRKESRRKPSSHPGSIATLPPASLEEPADPLPTAWEDAMLPASPLLPTGRSSWQPGTRMQRRPRDRQADAAFSREPQPGFRKLEGILYHRVMF